MCLAISYPKIFSVIEQTVSKKSEDHLPPPHPQAISVLVPVSKLMDCRGDILEIFASENGSISAWLRNSVLGGAEIV